jgi:predicted RNA-binding protein YlxR (DUF448 family)
MTSSHQRPKHIPTRMCISCRSTGAKRGLVRVVRTAEGRVAIDIPGKRNGRGAYLCSNPSCWTTALERTSMQSALRLSTLTEEDRATLTSFARTLTLEEPMTSRDVSTRQHGG